MAIVSTERLDIIGVAGYWVVDPEAKWVEVWDFAGGADRPTRYTDRLPVHVGDRILGEIELNAIFGR